MNVNATGALAGAGVPERVLCMCPRVEFWYIEGDFVVCKCGHPDIEHIMNSVSCVGVSEVSRGT